MYMQILHSASLQCCTCTNIIFSSQVAIELQMEQSIGSIRGEGSARGGSKAKTDEKRGQKHADLDARCHISRGRISVLRKICRAFRRQNTVQRTVGGVCLAK